MLLPELSIDDTAFFFDFDGTLSPIVDDPAMARPAPQALRALDGLLRASGGAVAIVSGRSLGQLDAFLAPLRPAAAGVHGLEIRYPDGSMVSHVSADAALRAAHDSLLALAARHDGLLVETKPGSVTLHYRMRPDLERECASLAQDLTRRLAGLELLPGKMVFELKQPGRTKVAAVEDFLEHEPFARRRLFYAGDDVADEEAFGYVQDRDGTAVKVGSGPTVARHRVDDPDALSRWLLALLA